MLCPMLLQSQTGSTAFSPHLFCVLPFVLKRAMLPDKIGQSVGGVEQLHHRACIILKEIRVNWAYHERGFEVSRLHRLAFERVVAMNERRQPACPAPLFCR